MDRTRVFVAGIMFFSAGCGAVSSEKTAKNDSIHCATILPARFAVDASTTNIQPSDSISTEGMVLIPAGRFSMGASDQEGRTDEYPQHMVEVKSFWMDATEVTNAQFKKFIDATGYITTAERKPDWEELKKQLPEGTPKPPDSVLVPSSLVFTPPSQEIALNNSAQWWTWVKGASWKHPQGPGSSIAGKENHPVVHISWEDANAYAKWAGKRLPTEAEWEFAARAGMNNQPFTWGGEPVERGKAKTNIWQGNFPDRNLVTDGFARSAPVRSYSPNAYGLYDIAGNVWEWCSDWYNAGYYAECASKTISDPAGASSSYDPEEPTVPKRVVRGGSFLCHASYCASYRVSARMKTSPDTGLEHTGFRCVRNK
jgi:sulfatase modifying factor 1